MATILVLDDRTLNRRFLMSLFAHHGHRALEALSGDQAMALLRAEQPEVVFTDIFMPNGGGCEFVARLRADPALRATRVVLRAAPYVAEEARALASAWGVGQLVTELADSTALLAAVEAALHEAPHSAAPGLPDPAQLYQLLTRLYRRVAELEMASVRLERESAEHVAQLEVARSALEQEVTKRLWAERELTHANLRLRAQAVRDPLTGLYNRRYLEESLDREESRAKRSGRPLGIIMIDIDHFKRWNDTYGHAAGDEVLRAVSRYMESLARTEDILCRYGGEEFVLVMTNTSPDTLWHRAEEVRTGVQKLTIEHDGQHLGPVTLSGGIAIFPDDGDDIYAVLQVADGALYRAKREGRNRIIVGSRARV